MSMQPAVLKANPGAEFDTPEQCWILELSNSAADPQLSIARARVAPGVTTHWHRLRGIAERYVIVEGTGRVEVADLAPREVAAGDVVLIPPGARPAAASAAPSR